MLDLAALLGALNEGDNGDPYIILERFGINQDEFEEQVLNEVVLGAAVAGATQPHIMFTGGFICGLAYAEAHKLEQQLGLDSD